MKKYRVPIEEQKKRKSDYQKRVREEKRKLGIPLYVPKLVPHELKEINMIEKKRKHREWIESEEGQAFFKKVSESKTKYSSTQERDSLRNERRKHKIHTDLEYCMKTRLSQCKYRAEKKNIPFDITVDDLLDVYEENCPYLGIRLTISGNSRNEPSALSIDKIIPELGYVKGNIKIISYKANMMKSDADLNSLVLFAKNVLRMFPETEIEEVKNRV